MTHQRGRGAASLVARKRVNLSATLGGRPITAERGKMKKVCVRYEGKYRYTHEGRSKCCIFSTLTLAKPPPPPAYDTGSDPFRALMEGGRSWLCSLTCHALFSVLECCWWYVELKRCTSVDCRIVADSQEREQKAVLISWNPGAVGFA